MKKRRLGEVLRERGHLSAADLNKVLLDQQSKRMHLGELLLQRGLVAKIDLISALAEVSTIPYRARDQTMQRRPAAQKNGKNQLDSHSPSTSTNMANGGYGPGPR